MAFLDQDEIDRLQLELASLNEKKNLAQSAKAKIKRMYATLVSYECPNDMNALQEIGTVINDINMKILTSSE